MKQALWILMIIVAVGFAQVYVIEEPVRSGDSAVIFVNYDAPVGSDTDGMKATVYFPETGQYYKKSMGDFGSFENRGSFLVIDSVPQGEQLMRIRFDNGKQRKSVWRYFDVY